MINKELCKCGHDKLHHDEEYNEGRCVGNITPNSSYTLCPCKKFEPQTPQDKNLGKNKQIETGSAEISRFAMSRNDSIKDFNLSEEIWDINYENCRFVSGKMLPLKEVKEFIKETREDIEGGYEGEELLRRFKKRAGEDLIK